MTHSSIPQESFNIVLAPMDGGRRGFSALGPEPGLPRRALAPGRQRGRGWSLDRPPAELMAILNQQQPFYGPDIWKLD